MEIYSKDLRIRALAAVDRGIPRREVVEVFSISLTTLKRWLRMRREGPLARGLHGKETAYPRHP
jgi:transposase